MHVWLRINHICIVRILIFIRPKKIQLIVVIPLKLKTLKNEKSVLLLTSTSTQPPIMWKKYVRLKIGNLLFPMNSRSHVIFQGFFFNKVSSKDQKKRRTVSSLQFQNNQRSLTKLSKCISEKFFSNFWYNKTRVFVDKMGCSRVSLHNQVVIRRGILLCTF